MAESKPEEPVNTSMTFLRQTGKMFPSGPRPPPRMACLFLAALVAALACPPCPASEIALTFVTVGDPGNPPNPRTYGSAGSVAYSYSIGKSPVTNAQFALFLDAVAADDLHRIYSPKMKIRRSRGPGFFSYTPLPGWEKHPVVFVAGIDAIRFCNWLHNNMPIGPQGHGTTEDGAYLIQGNDIPGRREPSARFFLPNRDEWLKAAFHDPTREAAIPHRFFATGSDEQPIEGRPSSLPGQVNAGNEVRETTAIDAYPNSQTYWGARDMGGNVVNWCEPSGDSALQPYIGIAFWGSSKPNAAGANSSGVNTNNSNREVGLGFRVAAIAPVTEEVTWGSLFAPSQRGRNPRRTDDVGKAPQPTIVELPVEKAFPEPDPELPPTTASIEKVRQLISRHHACKAGIEAKRAAALAVVEKEKAAGRLSPADASKLQLNIRPVSSQHGNSPEFLRTAIRLAAPHPDIAYAIADLDATATPLISKRRDFLDECAQALGEMTARAFLEKLTPEEIATRIALVQETRTIDCPDTYVLGREAHLAVLEARKALAEATPLDSPEADGQKAKACAVLAKVMDESPSSSIKKEAIQVCLRRHYAPYARAAIRCRHDLDLAIASGKPPPDLRNSFNDWIKASQLCDTANPHTEKRLENQGIAQAYRAVIDTIAAATESPGATAETIQSMRDEAVRLSVDLGPTRSAVFLPRLDQTVASLSRKELDQAPGGIAAIRQQLAGIRDPAALTAFAKGLPSPPDPRRDSPRTAPAPDNLRALRETLLSLAQAWNGADVEMFRNLRSAASAGDETYYPALQALFSRAERDILADHLLLPELTTGPLAAMDPETAMETLCDRLATRGEWRNLLPFLEARVGHGPHWPDPGWKDSVVAIKTYLRGQNNELAGLNAEAAACYRQTLQSLASRGPLREAAARLKALDGRNKATGQ